MPANRSSVHRVEKFLDPPRVSSGGSGGGTSNSKYSVSALGSYQKDSHFKHLKESHGDRRSLPRFYSSDDRVLPTEGHAPQHRVTRRLNVTRQLPAGQGSVGMRGEMFRNFRVTEPQFFRGECAYPNHLLQRLPSPGTSLPPASSSFACRWALRAATLAATRSLGLNFSLRPSSAPPALLRVCSSARAFRACGAEGP